MASGERPKPDQRAQKLHRYDVVFDGWAYPEDRIMAIGLARRWKIRK